MAGGSDGGFKPGQLFQFQVDAAHLAYTILGGFVVLFGMFSLLIKEKLYIGEAPIATVFGIIIGPYGAGIFDPRGWGSGNSQHTVNEITIEVTRVVLAVGVFAIGVELPKQYMLKHWKSIFFLLCPIMTYGWFVSAGLIYGLIPGLSFLSSLVIAACLTPTDPILAAAVVGGKFANKHVPAHIRHLLAAESGCNDGAAFPFLFIAIYLILDESDSHAVGEWFYITWLYEVALGILIGSLLGFGFRHLMKFCERKNLIDRHSYVAQYISLALMTIGVTTLLGSDDLLAAFACGTAFAWDGWFNKQTEESLFSNVIDLLFNCACFIYIGAWIPFADFNAPEFTLSAWRLVVLSLLVMLLRRLPIMIALYKFIPDIHTFHEALFSGHFGPIGVGAVFISTLASTVLPEPHNPPQNQVDMLGNTIQPVVAFMVLVSIAIHGLSIPFFSFGRRVHSIRHTWSRRQSMDPSGAPEWAHQVRTVPSRREDIIINRDPREMDEKKLHNLDDRMEKGILEDGTIEASPDASGSGSRSASGGSGIHTPIGEEMGDARPGDETEWREGPHLVVETEGGPGEEVQVRVFRNVFADHEGRPLERVESKVREEIDKFKEEAKHEGHMVTHLFQEKQPQGSTKLQLEPATDDAHERVTADEWNDEPITELDRLQGSPVTPIIHIDETASPARSTDPSHSPIRKARDRPNVLKAPVFIYSRSTGRRRESVRRALFGASSKPLNKPGPPPEGAGTTTSSLEHSLSSSAAGSTTDLSAALESNSQQPNLSVQPRGRSLGEGTGPKPAHSRASSLRAPRERGESPARVIRFANDGRPATSSGLAQSRTPSLVDLALSNSQAQSPGNNSSPHDSSRVMFDIPSPKSNK